MKQGGVADRLYESVAKQLIFKPTARIVDLLALQRAVEMEINDPNFGRLDSSQMNSRTETAATDKNFEQVLAGDNSVRLGEATRGHAPFTPNPERNRPKPGPISTNEALQERPLKAQSIVPKSTLTKKSSRSANRLEMKQISELKHQHYASHCQMCLCGSSPQTLAPVGSYIESEEVRQSVVEAHHVDLVQAGGARHAGNIILLCKRHHENYGRRLTRAGITSALQDSPKEISIKFDKNTTVLGRKIRLPISDTGEVVRLFFTNGHFDYWLAEASPPK